MPPQKLSATLRRRAELIALIVYSAVLLLVTWKHTFWRDETECWLLARDSHSLMGLLHNVRYQGHPPGWYFVLYLITFFTSNPEWMKLPDYLFSIASAAIILYKVRLPLSWRLGIIFSYYLVFEYTAIDRNYSLGILLLLWAAVSSTEKSQIKVPILLSLATSTSLPAIIVAVCMYPLHLAFSSAGEVRRSPVAWLRSLSRTRWVSAIFFASCVLAALAIIRPPADSGWAVHKEYFPPRIVLWNAFQQISRAYIPIPSQLPKFWNTDIVSQFPAHLGSIIGCVFAGSLTLFFRLKLVRWFFAIASFLILFQLKLSGHTYTRHVGWLFMVFMFGQIVEAAVDHSDGRESILRSPWRSVLVGTILSAQVVAGVIAVVESVRYPFSASKEAAAFLRQQHLDTLPMIVAPDYTAESILAYLEKPSAYYVEHHAYSSFVVWNLDEANRQHIPTRQEIATVTENGIRPVIVLDSPLSEAKRAELGITFLGSFVGAICSFDHYYIYR